MSDHSTFPVAGESTSNTSAPTTNGTTMQDVQNTVVNSEVQDPPRDAGSHHIDPSQCPKPTVYPGCQLTLSDAAAAVNTVKNAELTQTLANGMEHVLRHA